MPKTVKQDEHRFVLRLPEDLYAALTELARQHDRSLNGEIVSALRSYCGREARKPDRRKEE